MAGLILRKQDGTLLLDTTKITYGLVKSGYLVASAGWPRKDRKSLNSDPNSGSGWIDGTADPMWEFTVPDCIAPMLFIVGDGCLNGVVANGNSRTYIYGNASTNTKVYAFDKMREMGSGPRLRTRNASGVVTFNSYQVPLNVIAQVQAPGLDSRRNGTSYVTPYANGYLQVVQKNYNNIEYAKVSVPLSNEEYAVHLPFSRLISCVPTQGIDGYGCVEGAGGYTGGVQFMFGPAGATTQSAAGGAYIGYSAIPTDRMPVALVTRTSNLPFPFN